jgi:hypothetical protein
MKKLVNVLAIALTACVLALAAALIRLVGIVGFRRTKLACLQGRSVQLLVLKERY